MKVLQVFHNGQLMGTLEQNQGGQNHFFYSDRWQENPVSVPLSLSMPVGSTTYTNRLVTAYLRGLLPDNSAVLTRWAGQFGVSPNNPFGLLANVGKDVAGSVSFVEPAEAEEFLSDFGSEPRSEAQIAEHLRHLAKDEASWQDESNNGQFSLAGAQRKFALCQESDGTWSLPTGRKPTTHIFKPPIDTYADHDLNEYICLKTSAMVGLPTAEAELTRFEDCKALVVRRYDRIAGDDGLIVRLHQEDFCQSLGYPPDKKYQRDDHGPGAVAIIQHLRRHSTRADDDIETFIRALAFQWAIWGTDSHAKNYSLLLAEGAVRLAPLYDIASFLPYAKTGPDAKPVRLPMHVGREYAVRSIRRSHWEELASKTGLDPEDVCSLAREVITSTPAALYAVISDLPDEAVQSGFADKLLERVEKHCQQVNGDDVWPGMPRPKPTLYA